MRNQKIELLNAEILAYEIIQEYENQRKSTFVSKVLNVVIETIKIILSTIVSGVYTANQQTITSIVCFTVKWCLIFIAAYALFSFLFYVAHFFVNTVYNLNSTYFNRMKIRSKYEKVVKNYVTIGLESTYLSEEYVDLDIGISVRYAMHSLDCFERAANNLFEIIPARNTRGTLRENSNIKLIKHLGYNDLKSDIEMSIHSLKRLKNLINHLLVDENRIRLKQLGCEELMRDAKVTIADTIDKWVVFREKLVLR